MNKLYHVTKACGTVNVCIARASNNVANGGFLKVFYGQPNFSDNFKMWPSLDTLATP